MWQLILDRLLQQFARQTEKQVGRRIAGEFFNNELNEDEAYADRVLREFHLRDYHQAWTLYDSDRTYWKRLYGDDPLYSRNHPVSPPSSLVPHEPSPRAPGSSFLNPAPTQAGTTDPFGMGGQSEPGPAGSPRPLYKTEAAPWGASPSSREPVNSQMEEPAPGAPGAARPDDIRRLTRKSAPTPAAPATPGNASVPYLPYGEFDGRFGNWDMPRSDGSSQKASRPIGVFAGEPDYAIPPPIWGVEDSNSKRQQDAEEWFSRWVRPLLRQE